MKTIDEQLADVRANFEALSGYMAAAVKDAVAIADALKFERELHADTRKQLAEAQVLNARVIFVVEKIRCAGGSQEYHYWLDEMRFLQCKQSTSAIDAALQAAQEKP